MTKAKKAGNSTMADLVFWFSMRLKHSPVSIFMKEIRQRPKCFSEKIEIGSRENGWKQATAKRFIKRRPTIRRF